MTRVHHARQALILPRGAQLAPGRRHVALLHAVHPPAVGHLGARLLRPLVALEARL